MYDHDFYHEPSEFDGQIDDFKQSLLKSVKEDYQAEMQRLRTENAELQKVKRDWHSIKSELSAKIRNLENEREDMQRKVRRERLDQIMSDAKVVMYSPEYIEFESRKCNKCNDNRRIEYLTPLGKKSAEICDCSNKIRLWVPAENVLFKMYYNHDRNRVEAYYSIKNNSGYDSIENKSDSTALFFTTNQTTYEEVEDTWYRRMYFESEDECRKYCVWKTEKDAGVLRRDTESTESA